MESFKEEHRNGKVFSMDIQKLKNYASKHKMKVALGTTMAAALIAGASAGTYAYFTATQNAKTDVTLTKGSVELSEASGDLWAYYGNQADLSNIQLKLENYQAQTMINPYLSNGETAIGKNPATVFTGNYFSQVVPGDTFVKTVKIHYQGNNEAELAFKFQSKRQDWSTLANYYNLKVEYQINTVDKEGIQTQGSPHQLIANDSNAATLAELISETGTKISETVKKGDTIQMNFYAQLKAIDYDVEAAKNVVNFDTMSDLFEVHAKNKLYPKTSSDSK